MDPTPMATVAMRLASTDTHLPTWIVVAAIVLAVAGLLLYWRRDRLTHETVESPPPAQRHASERGVLRDH